MHTWHVLMFLLVGNYSISYWICIWISGQNVCVCLVAWNMSKTKWLDLYYVKSPSVIVTCTIPFGIHRADYEQVIMHKRIVSHPKYKCNMATTPRLPILRGISGYGNVVCGCIVLRIDSGARIWSWVTTPLCSQTPTYYSGYTLVAKRVQVERRALI